MLYVTPIKVGVHGVKREARSLGLVYNNNTNIVHSPGLT
jgi:hypothetical protein